MATPVEIRLTHHDPAEGEVPAAGLEMEWHPIDRRIREAPDRAITRRPFGAMLDDDGYALLTVDPGLWMVVERSHPVHKRLIDVPDTTETAFYVKLPSLDPATHQPSPEALAGWEAATTKVRELRDDAYALLPQMTATQGAAEAIAADVRTVTELVQQADGHAFQAGQHRTAVEQIRTELEGMGLDPEEVASAVADYLAENPVEGVTAAELAAAIAAIPPPDLSGYVTTSDARLSDARTPTAHSHPWGEVQGKPEAFPPTAHEHPEYLTGADLPAPPDLSGYVTTSDARLSDARTPTAHSHPEYLTDADLSDVIRKGDERLTNARTPLAHGHTVEDVDGLTAALAGKSDTGHSHSWNAITAKPSTFPAATHNHDTAYYTKSQVNNLLASLPPSGEFMEETVAVPNTGWDGDSVELSVPGMTGVCWVSPVTAAGAATWAAGGWHFTSPEDGVLLVEGTPQPLADPVDVTVIWWQEV